MYSEILKYRGKLHTHTHTHKIKLKASSGLDFKLIVLFFGGYESGKLYIDRGMLLVLHTGYNAGQWLWMGLCFHKIHRIVKGLGAMSSENQLKRMRRFRLKRG